MSSLFQHNLRPCFISILRPIQRFEDGNFKFTFINENYCIMMECWINNMPLMVQVWLCDKPLSEPMVASFTDAYVSHTASVTVTPWWVRWRSQITSLAIVYSTVYSGADQRKHQSSASLAFVPVKRGKCFHLMTSSCDEFISSRVPSFQLSLSRLHVARDASGTTYVQTVHKKLTIQW